MACFCEFEHFCINRERQSRHKHLYIFFILNLERAKLVTKQKIKQLLLFEIINFYPGITPKWEDLVKEMDAFFRIVWGKATINLTMVHNKIEFLENL